MAAYPAWRGKEVLPVQKEADNICAEIFLKAGRKMAAGQSLFLTNFCRFLPVKFVKLLCKIPININCETQGIVLIYGVNFEGCLMVNGQRRRRWEILI